MTKPDWVEPLVEAVQRLMDERFWDTAELTRRSGKDRGTIDKFLNADYGARGPDYATVRHIMQAFGRDGVKALRELGHEGWARGLEREIEDTENGLAGIRRELHRQSELLRKMVDLIDEAIEDDPDVEAERANIRQELGRD